MNRSSSSLVCLSRKCSWCWNNSYKMIRPWEVWHASNNPNYHGIHIRRHGRKEISSNQAGVSRCEEPGSGGGSTNNQRYQDQPHCAVFYDIFSLEMSCLQIAKVSIGILLLNFSNLAKLLRLYIIPIQKLETRISPILMKLTVSCFTSYMFNLCCINLGISFQIYYGVQFKKQIGNL